MLEFLVDLFEGWGLTVESFTDGEEALKRFSNEIESINFVVLDQTMPTITGLQLATRMLKQNSKLPVILYTGYSDVVDEESALRAGVRALVRKPLDIENFSILVREILEQS